MLTIRDRELSTIGVVDDNVKARQSRNLLISDSNLDTYDVAGPLTSVAEVAERLARSCDAVICDHHLNANAIYASFLGAELVAQAVRDGLPAVLCTRYMTTEIVDIRPHLPYIPVFVSPRQLRDPVDLRDALDTCIGEMSGEVVPERRLWRAQIVIEELAESDTFIASVPGWDTGQVIQLRRSDVPESLRASIAVGFRTFVRANLDEERPEHFFVTDWRNW